MGVDGSKKSHTGEDKNFERSEYRPLESL